MNRLYRVNILVFMIILSLAATAWSKDRVAVMDFDNKSQHGGWRLGQGASDILTTELVKTGKFSVMERDQLASIIKEQDMGASGRFDASTAARIGKIVGVEYMITGAITEYGMNEVNVNGDDVNVGRKGYHATVDIRMVDTTTGEIVFADSASGSKSSLNLKIMGFGGGETFSEKKATEAMRKAITLLAKKITSTPLQSSGGDGETVDRGSVLVADVDGSIVTLNKGSNAGLEAGQALSISRKGKVIKDPQTGKVLKIKYTKIGKIKLTEVEEVYSEGEIIEGTGFLIGDIVK